MPSRPMESRFTRAIVRSPAPTLGKGLTTVDLGQPDYGLACRQHDAYCATLERAGLTVTVLEALPDYPDAHFVEDVAVPVGATVVLTRPGAAPRREEVAAIRPIFPDAPSIVAPGFLDGGDVLQVGRHFVVGLSARTNAAGAEQFGAVAEQLGFSWQAVRVPGGLHLETSVNALSDRKLIATAEFSQEPWVRALDDDPLLALGYEANVVRVNDFVLIPSGFPETSAKLQALGYALLEVSTSEYEKMDGGLSCLSLRLP